jgi:hypothetical protein
MNNENNPMIETEEEWLAIRKEAGPKIDPETAEVDWDYGLDLDRYGLYALPEELQQVGRQYWARSPASDIWVQFGNLPDDVRENLRDTHRARLAFPAGLEKLFTGGKKTVVQAKL